ncbi:lipase chaperone [Trinickia violacea]|uniref:Lipase chaperone n=1 Tax=Trinickia violacea TaxID=2571746 RepID=A0A4V1EIQ9_9BURK|nr:lipase secretion chaperone [Trinickia violacea]QCP54630.1 lipase chaperone [Trinickia violacea]
MARNGNGLTRRHYGVLFIAASVALAGAVWLFAASKGANGPDTAKVADVPRAGAAAAASAMAATSQALPASLAGSSVPRLPVGDGGHLLKTRAVRDFFDYLMTAQDDMSPAALDALVRRQIAAQLDGTAAQAEALDVWRRYLLYQDGLAHLPGVPAPPDGKLNFDAVQLSLEQRASLASRTMGEWDAPFFGDERQHQQLDLERMRIAADPSLSDAQKQARMQALEQQLPPEERAARERMRKQQQAIDAVAALQKGGASADAMRAQVAQTLGPDAAERVVQMQKDEDAWQAKYAEYAAQRAQIDAQGLSPESRDARIAQLRQQVFPNPSDAMRAASLDRGAGG